MKRIISSLLFLFVAVCVSYGQAEAPKDDAKPTDSLALFKVLVTNLKNMPSKGDKITFVNPKTGASYAGISGPDGRFEIAIPKGEHLEVRFLSLGKDSVLRTIDVPNPKGKVTFNYTLKYELPRLIKLDNVYFDTNKTTLKPASFQTLDNLVELMQHKPEMEMEIAGHTDNVGGADFNKKLSQGRADAVKVYLVKKGIAEARIQAIGYGMSQPVDTNDTPEGRKNNRRTEAHILKE